jgi:hypothetical protein
MTGTAESSAVKDFSEGVVKDRYSILDSASIVEDGIGLVGTSVPYLGIGKSKSHVSILPTSIGSSEQSLSELVPGDARVAAIDAESELVLFSDSKGKRLSGESMISRILDRLLTGKSGVTVKQLDLPTIDSIPSEAFRLYGCVGCDWKYSTDCEYTKVDKETFKNGNVKIRKGFRMPRGGICQRRTFWLLYMSRNLPSMSEIDGDRRIKKQLFSVWHEGFLKNRAAIQLNNDMARLDRLISELDIMEQTYPDDVDKLDAIEARRKIARDEWQFLWKELLASESKSIERELPKKVEIEHKRDISLTEVRRLMRGEIADRDSAIDVVVDDSK